ncbi:MAG: hypothetical protein OEZ06_14525 [Myxococcales bacterium]|nr:hypothetical protein [Myxococcales bacterium]
MTRGPCDARAVAVAALRIGAGSSQLIDRVLEACGQKPLQLDPAPDLGIYGFKRRELAVVEALAARPQSLDELLSRRLLPPQQLWALLYLRCLTSAFVGEHAPGRQHSGRYPVGTAASGSRPDES